MGSLRKGQRLNTVLLVGLACVYLWYLIALAEITNFLQPIRDSFPMLIGCAWCLGFWLTGAVLAVTGNYDPLTHLATATVVGVVGTLVA